MTSKARMMHRKSTYTRQILCWCVSLFIGYLNVSCYKNNYTAFNEIITWSAIPGKVIVGGPIKEG